MAQRTILYLDFADGTVHEAESTDTIAQTSEGSWPVGSVFIYVSNTDPATILGFGVWSLLGSGTIGVTTVYYFQRTD